MKTSLISLLALIVGLAVGYKLMPHPGPASSSGPSASSTSTAFPASSANNVTIPDGGIVIPVSIVSLQENASSSPSVSIEYPQFPSLPADINTAIATAVTDRLAEFKKDAAANSAARAATSDPNADLPPDAFSFIATWQEAQISSQYVSFILRFDSYTGGANEDQEIRTFDYDIANDHIMTLADLFPNDPNYLNTISTQSRQQLTDSMNTASNGNVPTDMLNAGTGPTADNFQDFTFTDDTITIYFPKYAVAPGSFGEQHVTLPRNAMLPQSE